MSRVRDGVNGCWCCGFRLVDERGWCDVCIGRGHDKQPLPGREQGRAQASPRDRQKRQPGRNR
ncbi:MAG: hypothetical protein HOY78_32415 [Saccharothrix sp.]|nr:hypothetical protein [Saccharothrix sp.]